MDAIGFIASTRRTFSPDAAWYVGPDSGEKVVEGVPALAVEVRSPEDYGPAAQRRMAAERAAYFSEGTLVVWDVDVLREGWIRCYRASEPEHPALFRRGEIADAEPALPGWRFRPMTCSGLGSRKVIDVPEWPELRAVPGWRFPVNELFE